MSKKLETLGLVEVTSQRQASNGTVCYHDPVTGCDYMSYESGYVRRSYKTTSWWSGKTIQTIYQLNKTRKVKQTLELNGQLIECTERILEPNPDVRFDMIAKAAVNYRKTLNK
jgi:hypothetical protein